jgi:SAM-dependent methyltransferase
MLETVDCVFCGAGDGRSVYSRRDSRYRLDDQVYSMCRCPQCGGLYLSPRAPASDIWKYYPTDYYANTMTPGQIMRAELTKNVAKYAYLSDMRPGRLLDVGCRHGAFVKFMQLFDWQAEGYERNTDVPNRFDCPITYGPFADIADQRYDVITLWAVFEHVYDPNAYVEQFRQMLPAGGKLVLQVPKFNSFSGRFLRIEDVPRHVTAFTPAWLTAYLGRHGFRRVAINTRCDVFWGSSEGTLGYLYDRLRGKSADEALYALCGHDRDRSPSARRKLDSVFGWYFDRILKRLDAWGQMTLTFEKE